MVDYRTTRLQTKDVRHHRAAFTLAELLVSVGVLVLLVLLATQLLNSAATITTWVTNKWTPTHKRDSSWIEWLSISHS